MKVTGIVRKIDELGRVVIPAEARGMLHLESGDLMDIAVDGNAIILTKELQGCIFCSGNQNIREYRGVIVCEECMEELSRLNPVTR